MRIVKDAQERRCEILDAAMELFGTKGFEGTSTNDILEKVGIARGTLYYHFKSKEEILDAAIERLSDQIFEKARKIAGRKDLPLFKRLPLTVLAFHVDTSLGLEIMTQVHKPQNALMHQKMQDTILGKVNPVILELVEEGIREGIFQTEYPAEAVEMVLLYSNVTFDDQNDTEDVQKQKKTAGFIYNVERLLGAEPGTLREPLMEIFMENSQRQGLQPYKQS